MEKFKMSVLSAVAAGAVLFTGCGGGGGGESVSDCDKVPAWTAKKAPMQSFEDVQNGMAVIYGAAKVYEYLYDGKRLKALNGGDDVSGPISELSERLVGLDPAYMKRSLEYAVPMDRIGVYDENCSVSGTKTISSDYNETESGYVGYYSISYHQCVEYAGYIREILREELFPVYIVANESYEPTTDTYTLNGTLKLKRSREGNESETCYENRITADSLTVDMEDNESLDRGKLDANIFVQGKRCTKENGTLPTQIEDAVEATRSELTSDGCLSLYVDIDDGNGSRTRMVDAKVQAVDFNATMGNLLIVAGEKSTKEHYVTVNGYIGLSGYVKRGSMFLANGSYEKIDLSGYAVYGKGFRMVEMDSGQDGNGTVSGTFATPCMGGAVTYEGNMSISERYYSKDDNKSVMPFKGKITLKGENDAVVEFYLNDVNRSFAIAHVGDQNRTYGSWSALTEGNCSKLFEEIGNLAY